MVKSEDRPKGMSWLDWLWLNYNHFNVQNEPSDIPSSRIILTEQAISRLVNKATGGGITSLEWTEDPDYPAQMRLMGKDIAGNVLTLVRMPKEEHIISFANRQVTQADVDNGCEFVAGTHVLAITTNLGKTYMINIAALEVQLSGRETDTVYTEVDKGVITANVKIDEQNNKKSAVRLNRTNKGLYSLLSIDDEPTDVRLEITENGLKASLPVTEEGMVVKFQQMTLNEYLSSQHLQNVVYFITDKPFIYLNEIRYGIDLALGDQPIVALTYNEEEMTLYYRKADGSDTQKLVLGPVSSETNGMVTKEQYNEFVKLKKAIGDITNVSEYVEQIVSTAAFSLEKGEVENRRVPLYLKNKLGNILSTVYMDTEDYLSFAEQRAATHEDRIECMKKGIRIKEGDALLILTLVSGDNIYVNLNELVDIYEGLRTKTVQVNVKDYEISAEIILPENEQILYESANGLTARISVKQNKNIVSIYGKTETEADKLGQIYIGDQLLGYRVFKLVTVNMTAMYPPSYVDGKPYDAVENPVHYGNIYIVLTMGLDTGDSATSYQYHYYLDMTGLLDEILLSSDPDNLLSKGSDGHLYASLRWYEMNS